MVLLAVFLLPLVSPLLAFAADGDGSGLPACCRRSGQHHCAMMMGQDSVTARHADAPDTATVGTVTPRCPCCPGVVPCSTHAEAMAFAPTRSLFAELLSHPMGVVQTESRRRIAADRTRQKRGPPSIPLA